MAYERERDIGGCLCIGELTSGTSAGSGPFCCADLPGLRVQRFRSAGEKGLWERLQSALQALRAECGRVGILARGTGCAAALALAEQLPVERLALVEPRLSPPGLYRLSRGRGRGKVPSGELRRLLAFAKRNLSLCVSEALIVERGRGEVGMALYRGGLRAHSRVTRVLLRGENGDELYTIRENAVKQAVSCFLHTGELPKALAENPEMCIIYG